MFENYESDINPKKAQEPLRTTNQTAAYNSWHITPMEPEVFKARGFDDQVAKLKAKRNRRKDCIRNKYKDLLRDTDKAPHQYIQLVEGKFKEMSEVDDLFDAKERTLEETRSRAFRGPRTSPDSDAEEPRVHAECLETGMPVKPHTTDRKTWALRQEQNMRLQMMRDRAEEIQRAERHLKASLKAYGRFQSPGWLQMHMDMVAYTRKCHAILFDLVKTERDRPIEKRRPLHRRHRHKHRHCHCRLRRDVNPVPDLSDLGVETVQPLDGPAYAAVDAGGSVENMGYAAFDMGPNNDLSLNDGANGQVESTGYAALDMGTNGYTAFDLGTNGGVSLNDGTAGQVESTGYAAFDMGTNSHAAFDMGIHNDNGVSLNEGTAGQVESTSYAAAGGHGYEAFDTGTYGGVSFNEGTAGQVGSIGYAAFDMGVHNGVSLNEGTAGQVESTAYAAFDMGTNDYAAFDMGVHNGVSLNEGTVGQVGSTDYAAFDMGTNGGVSLNEGTNGQVDVQVDVGPSPSSPEIPTKRRRE